MRLFDFGRNYAKNYASIIRQGLPNTVLVLVLHQHACMGKRITRRKGLLTFHPVCDYCEVLCEILIFGNHISLISYFLDGVQGSLEAIL